MTKEQRKRAVVIAKDAVREMQSFTEGFDDLEEADTLMKITVAYAQGIRMVVSASELHDFMETLEKGAAK